MKYQFVIHASILPEVLSVYKKTGGYLEIQPIENAAIKVIADNEEFLYHKDFEEMKLRTPLTPIHDQSENIRKEVLSILQELTELPTEANTACGPFTIPSVIKPQLQRRKLQQKETLDYHPDGKRTKWEVLCALQAEFDKFPDDTKFDIRVFEIGTFGTRYI